MDLPPGSMKGCTIMSQAELIDKILRANPAMQTRISAILNAPVAITARVDALLNGQTIVCDDKPKCELWTISQTARELGICRRLVRGLIAAHEIETVAVPFGHPANRTRVTAASVDEYCKRLKMAAMATTKPGVRHG